ncbi:MAG TPA: selenide, water dikinase SelD [Chitinophagaceae bacterium]|nr:selenide, water dikinase SelD [Chitinophagaceae bacterium]
MSQSENKVRLTQYSHGAGCGCKISPKILESILAGSVSAPNDKLLVGNHSRDDAAAYDLGNGMALISTTDFFMPIVDDPYNFGRIAAANAISDVYAMGGKPALAIAILGWPINKLEPAIAQQVIAGGRSICEEAGISLAGGHSIDSPEPIFGLAVNGLVQTANLKRNNTAREGDLLFLTKSIGVGILTTAEKKGLLKPEDEGIAARQMMQLNKVGEALGAMEDVHALTDVTGFGFLGHLGEMAAESNLTARIADINRIPLLTPRLREYMQAGAVPGGTHRNWQSYGHLVQINDNLREQEEYIKLLLSDPQTSGGLLIAVAPEAEAALKELLQAHGLNDYMQSVGYLAAAGNYAVEIGQ